MATLAGVTAPARLLAFDTATEVMALALCDGEKQWLRELPGGAAASSALMPALQALLDEAGLTYAQIDAIGFGRGPGAFTGVRTSAAVAQGLAFGIGCPVLPLCSLMLVAEAWRLARPGALSPGDEVAVLMDARMQEMYAARYAWTGVAWQPQGEARLLADPALLPPPGRGRAGEGVERPLKALLGTALLWPSAPWRLQAEEQHPSPGSRPQALASLARQAHAAGAGVDAALALPLYLRDKVALTTAERAVAKTTNQAAA